MLQSTCGVQQGDPLGPMLFSLAIHEVTEELVRMGIQAVWYLDDGTIMGSPEEVARGYQLVAQKCAKWGLSVNAQAPRFLPGVRPQTREAVSPCVKIESRRGKQQKQKQKQNTKNKQPPIPIPCTPKKSYCQVYPLPTQLSIVPSPPPPSPNVKSYPLPPHKTVAFSLAFTFARTCSSVGPTLCSHRLRPGRESPWCTFLTLGGCNR